jgi:hypothetical protein
MEQSNIHVSIKFVSKMAQISVQRFKDAVRWLAILDTNLMATQDVRLLHFEHVWV